MTDKINRKRNTKFSQISNKILYDERLSYRARGIFAYLWAKPDDWKVLVKYDLVKNGKETEFSIRNALRELREFGYMDWKRIYKPANEELKGKGKKLISGIEYFLDDEGLNSLRCDSQHEDGLDEDGQHEYNNTDLTNTYLTNTECNAGQSNFSQNVSSDLPLTHDNFKEEWEKVTTKAPARDFDKGFVIFQETWNVKMTEAKRKKYNNSWIVYLKEWIKNEYGFEDNKEYHQNAEKTIIEPEVVEKVDIHLTEELETLNNAFEREFKKQHGNKLYNYYADLFKILKVDKQNKKIHFLYRSERQLNNIFTAFNLKFQRVIEQVLELGLDSWRQEKYVGKAGYKAFKKVNL